MTVLDKFFTAFSVDSPVEVLRLHHGVTKQEIQANDFEDLQAFFKIVEGYTLKVEVLFSVEGYEDSKVDLIEIPEIHNYIRTFFGRNLHALGFLDSVALNFVLEALATEVKCNDVANRCADRYEYTELVFNNNDYLKIIKAVMDWYTPRGLQKRGRELLEHIETLITINN